jgi:hypothetical protein
MLFKQLSCSQSFDSLYQTETIDIPFTFAK